MTAALVALRPGQRLFICFVVGSSWRLARFFCAMVGIKKTLHFCAGFKVGTSELEGSRLWGLGFTSFKLLPLFLK